MTAGPVLSFLVLCEVFVIVMMAAFAIRRRADEAQIAPLLGRVRDRSPVQAVIIATDADLKVEFLFFSYMLLAVIATSLLQSPRAGDEILALLAVIAGLQGYTFRQWLSRWRFRHIVNIRLLTTKASFYGGSRDVVAELLINQLLFWWLLWISPFYAFFQVAGFLFHEASSEVRKRRFMLRRKLHLFDLDFIPKKEDRARLASAIHRFQLSVIRQMAYQTSDTRQALLLRTFDLWLRNDFSGVDRVFEENRRSIEGDAKLLYYFGKSFYARGDVQRATELLKRGWGEYGDVGCRAYLVLCELAVDRSREKVTELLQEIKEDVPQYCSSKAEMFLCAYYALALGIFSGRADDGEVDTLRDALYHIHEAMRFNQRIYEGRELGPLQSAYFAGNNQIFIDIYGYIVLRQGNQQLSFRILESAIVDDNTYPWPYFHIALLYERVGRAERARSIYYRIAANEVSDSVLRRLCLRRLERQAGELDGGEASS